MKQKKIYLKKGIKAVYREAFDPELAEIACKLFGQNLQTDCSDSYKLELIKTKENCKTYKLSRGNNVYFLKKFFEPSFHKNVQNLFRTSKALRCFSTAFKLAAVNISVAEPVMYLTCSSRIIKKESILITKKAAGVQLMDFLKSQDVPSDAKEKALLKLFHSLGYFYKHRFKHGDPCLYNYFVDPENDEYLITFIDLDQVHQVAYMPDFFALHSLVKISTLGGGTFLTEHWPTYVQTFLNAYNPKITLDKAICSINKQKDRKGIFRFRKHKKGLQ